MEENKKHFVGMRIVKTVIAVYVSTIITVLMNGVPINASVAAVLTTQDSQEGSLNYGKNRIIGTFIGGVFAVFFVFLVDTFNIPLFTIEYYTVLSLLLIPLVKFVLFLNLKGSVSSALITFLISLMSYISQEDLKYSFVIGRIIYTFVGVVVSLIVNKILPDNRNK